MGTNDIERNIMTRVWWRIIPLLTVVLFFSYLDKVNVGFAALQMNRALGFSNAVFGAGAGSFAVGYALFAVPSTLLLHRVGARRWISLIVLAWGACSAATAFVTRPEHLLASRILLGAAEAGFAPGVILYFSYWFPSEYRGRALSSFTFIQPVALIIGGPVSTALLSLNGVHGLAGWQWLFLIEALPTLLLALLVYGFLADRPDSATWLSMEEKRWLAGKLAGEKRRIEALHAETSLWRTLGNKRVLLLALVFLGISTSGTGTVFFLPLVIKSMGFSVANTGFISALPGIAAALSLPFWGLWVDRARSRELVVAAAGASIAVGLFGTAALLPHPLALVPLSFAMVGYFGFAPVFWTLPSTFLTGVSAAAGLAFINIAGNAGYLTGPPLLGRVSDVTHSYGTGLSCLAVVAAVISIVMGIHSVRSRAVPFDGSNGSDTNGEVREPVP
jgi:MFS transporter, ACS family, tartrate transporter